MRSSSKALVACMFALVTVYLPILLTPDALAQTVLPTPNLTSITQVAEPAQTTVSTSSRPQKVAAAPTKTISNTSLERLLIPSIGLNDPIVPVGVDSTGAMAVPNGKTSEVGWYDDGPQPGGVGSAVLDAHVFAAFKNLNEVKVGDSIYVNENGQSLHFVVTAIKLYALSQITSQDLFTPTSDRDLNLITCAGQLTPDHSTYDHRLVVYATLAS